MENIKIHPTAIVSDKAQIGKGTEIGPFSIIEDDVIIGENNIIKSSVLIGNGARIGNNNEFFHSAVISNPPQDLKYNNERTFAIIGDNNCIREFVTVHRGTADNKETKIGSNCLLMAYSHIAHDCYVGDNVILANVTQLGGHVRLDDWVICGGMSKFHQFTRVGAHAMTAADARVMKDVPPFTLIGREPPKIEGINKIGLRRRGFTDEQILKIKAFYDILLFSGLNTRDGIAKVIEKGDISPEIEYCISFIQNSSRGIYR